MLLNNKRILVTGASRGLGAQMAQSLAQEGALVCVNYLQRADSAKTVVDAIVQQGGTAFAYQADVTQADAVHKMVEHMLLEFGGIDVVVNNALPNYQFDPSAASTRIDSVDWTHFTHQLTGVVQGALNTTQAVLPAMRKQGMGKIINISTNLLYNPVVPYHDYTAAKAALVGLTRTMAAELGPDGIRVNVLAGGLLDVTDASALTSKEVFDYIATTTPLRKTTTTTDFANAVVMMASDLSNAITGQSISVDGGLTMP